MHLKARQAFALTLLALLPEAGFPLDAPQGRGADMAKWKTSPAWRKYKAAFDQVQGVESMRALEKLEDEAGALESSLPRVFPEDPELSRSLLAALRVRLQGRRRGLQTPRGRLPRPDWKAELSGWVERLGHDTSALRRLRALGVRDPWIEAKLAPAVKHSAAGVEAALESLEKQLPGDPETGPLAARARESLQPARALLAEPGPGR